MLKLIKYDIIKSKAWFLISGAVIALVELLFLSGWIFDKSKLMNVGYGLFMVVGFFGLLALLIYSVQLYTNELNKKSGYMTFLTPRNAYQIIGSKLIVSFIALVVAFVIYFALFLANIKIYENVDGNIIGKLFSLLDADEVPAMLLFVFTLIFEWFVTIISIYFSVTLSMTLLGNIRCRWIISALIFLAINAVMSVISSMLVLKKALVFSMGATESSMNISLFSDKAIGLFAITLAINVVFAVGIYIGTAALAEKKLSM